MPFLGLELSQTAATLATASVMVVVFVTAWGYGLPHIQSLILSAVAGALPAGYGVPLRHLVEGSFMFFDLVLVILTATIFIGVIRASGALHAMIRDILHGFGHRPLVLLSLMTLVVMLPGALTGSGTAAVLAVGAVVGTVLTRMGIPKNKAVSILALGGIVGSFAPPINIPAMAMANGINMPYVGLFVPLLVISVPLGIGSSLWLGARHVRHGFDRESALRAFHGEAGAAASLPAWKTYGPLVAVLGLMIGLRVAPETMPELGIPLVFVIGIVVAWLMNPRVDLLGVSRDMVHEAMPVASILIGVGALVQVMTLTGVQGLFVVTAITLPLLGLYVFTYFGFAAAGSLLGSYGSGTVFGIPVALAFLDRDPIMAVIGLSLLAAYSSLTPPTAIVGQASVVAMQYERGYSSVLRHVAMPWVLASFIGILIVVFANRLDFLVFF